MAARSFGDIVGGAIGSDLQLMAAGYLVVMIYVMIMLGKEDYRLSMWILSKSHVFQVDSIQSTIGPFSLSPESSA